MSSNDFFSVRSLLHYSFPFEAHKIKINIPSMSAIYFLYNFSFFLLCSYGFMMDFLCLFPKSFCAFLSTVLNYGTMCVFTLKSRIINQTSKRVQLKLRNNKKNFFCLFCCYCVLTHGWGSYLSSLN